MKNKFLFSFIASLAITLGSSCDTDLEEVQPVNTIEVRKNKLADTEGVKTKIFFPKDPVKK